jgi:hypothetical protein
LLSTPSGACSARTRARSAANRLRQILLRRDDLLVGTPTAAAPRDPLSRTNQRYMPRDKLLEVARENVATLRATRWALCWLKRAHLAACARVRSLSERLEEYTSRGDTGALIADLISCERAGAWEQRQVLFNFMRDMVHAVMLTDSETGATRPVGEALEATSHRSAQQQAVWAAAPETVPQATRDRAATTARRDAARGGKPKRGRT